MYLPPTDSFPKAKAAAMKALELDDTLAEAHVALGYAAFFDWDWPTAEREFKRAIELNPNSSLSHRRYAECLKTRLRFNESIAEAQLAQELDPLSPDIASELGNVHFVAGQYDASIAQFQKALDLNPNIPVLRGMLASAYAMKRMYPQALAEYDKISDQDKVTAAGNQFVAGMLGWVYAVSGRRTDALKIAQEFKDLSAHAYVDFYWSGVICAGLGDKDEAFRFLEKLIRNMPLACSILQWTHSGMGCAPTRATPTCCAESDCRNQPRNQWSEGMLVDSSSASKPSLRNGYQTGRKTGALETTLRTSGLTKLPSRSSN
jgi:tetratricopeptide (TPR) repeat protein